MPKRLYPLHHQDAHLTYAFENKGHIQQQTSIISRSYNDPTAQKKRQ